jgi:tRNA pseudouridine38-40 synthase
MSRTSPASIGSRSSRRTFVRRAARGEQRASETPAATLLSVRILLTLQYLGTRYAGWQTQANATGVQQVVERALSTMFQSEIRIEGAGRTDSGVHARAQKAHADVPFEIPERGFLMGVNDLLPPDIRITDFEPVTDDFHCRFAAKTKSYVYQIWNGPFADVFTFETHAHVAQPLDEKLMHEAAQALVGQHDFRAFTVAAPEVSSTCRTIAAIGVEREGEVIRIRVSADGFLRYMVRRIAGSLIEIGRGKLGSGALRRSIEPAFEEARWTAPAKGLTLWDIAY